MASSSSRAPEDPNVLRRQLLIELSVLRRRYAQLSAEGRDSVDGGDDTSIRRRSGAESVPRSDMESSSDGDDEGPLCQSDRDAIEALFHSVDDFTRDFNEGRGGLERGDIVSRIMRGNA